MDSVLQQKRGSVMGNEKPSQLTNDDSLVEFEGNIRNLARPQSSASRRLDASGEQATSIVRRVSLEATRDIDRLMTDLSNMRAKLEAEGDRIQREILGYASLSQSVVELTKIISDSMANIKKVSDAPSISVEEPKSIVPSAIESR
jgi:hypothetical protein